jgi:serine-type D-Ala-D-Ala carboxypeptidase/endopeptidase (penicillin-binding protein 4)
MRSTALLPLLLVLAGAGCAPALGGLPGPATALASEVHAALADPALHQANVGFLVRSLQTGETIYSHNAEGLFVPASTVKLVTGAAALETLGTHFRYRTTFAADGPIRNGVLEGSLVVIGTGDPTFSGRFLADPRDTFRSWADSLRAHGVTRISGGIVAVDTAFTDPPLGTGWAWDDLSAGYSAEFGPLQFNEGVVRLEIFPSSTTLAPAVVVLTPATQYVRIFNDTRTVPAGNPVTLQFARDDAGAGITVRGEIPADSDGVIRTVAVRDPALYFAAVLRETLREQGVPVEGPSATRASLDPAGLGVRSSLHIFSHGSPPLGEIVPAMMKPSQNQIAETLLRTVGREVLGEGSAAAGAAVADSLFGAWELPLRGHRIADGSGLSRYNLLSPTLLVDLLARMDRSYFRDAWVASLPVAGVDGTLANRMREEPLRERVVAKTGTLSNTRALAGYLTTSRGERLVFAVLVNSHLASVADVDRVVEGVLERIAAAR